MPEGDPWSSQFGAVGEFIRRQRNLANLSIREVADLASVSNAYLSQIERGLHEPSVRVLTSVARALNVSAETLLAQAGLLNPDGKSTPKPKPPGPPTTEAAIAADPDLSDAQKQALRSVYRSFLAEGRPPAAAPKRRTAAKTTKKGGHMTPGEVVTEFIRRIGQIDVDGACELLAPDVHYDNVPMEPKHDGRDTVRDVLKTFLGESPSVEWKVERQTETGNVVMNERVDQFHMLGKPLSIPVMGVWEVNGAGLITLWRDYFDMETVNRQLA